MGAVDGWYYFREFWWGFRDTTLGHYFGSAPLGTVVFHMLFNIFLKMVGKVIVRLG